MYVCVCCRSTHCDCRHSVYSHSRRSHIMYKPSLRVCVFVYMDGVLWSKRCGWTCDNKTNKRCVWTCPQSKRESVSNNPSHLSLRGTQGAMANVSTHTAFTQFDQSRRVDDGSRDGLFFLLLWISTLRQIRKYSHLPCTNRSVLSFVVVGGVAICLHCHHGFCLCNHRTDIQKPASSERVTALRICSALFPFKELRFLSPTQKTLQDMATSVSTMSPLDKVHFFGILSISVLCPRWLCLTKNLFCWTNLMSGILFLPVIKTTKRTKKKIHSGPWQSTGSKLLGPLCFLFSDHI